ncbi:MAG: hypothetical protein M3416_01260 [Acidobacteriota bacterium]|nr:hypothetical protein [Acidobacteriota bacterium]
MGFFDSIRNGLKRAFDAAVRGARYVASRVKTAARKAKNIIKAGTQMIPAGVKAAAAKALRSTLRGLKDIIWGAIDAWIQDILHRTTHRIVVEIYNFVKVRVLNSEAVKKTYERLVGLWKRRKRNKVPLTPVVRNELYRRAVQETRARASYTVPLTREDRRKVRQVATDKPVIRKLTVSPEY